MTEPVYDHTDAARAPISRPVPRHSHPDVYEAGPFCTYSGPEDCTRMLDTVWHEADPHTRIGY